MLVARRWGWGGGVFTCTFKRYLVKILSRAVNRNVQLVILSEPAETSNFVLVVDLVSRSRIGGSGHQSRTKSPSPTKVTDVRQLLEEKRQGLSQHRQPPQVAASGKTGAVKLSLR